MKLFIFIAFGLFVVTNNINTANAKLCGGIYTKALISQRLNEYTRKKLCYANQIDSNALITAAHCVDGKNPKDLMLIIYMRANNKPLIYNRNVSKIFIHPNYTSCDGKNGLAILSFDAPPDALYDKVCLGDKPYTDLDSPFDCLTSRLAPNSEKIDLFKVAEHCRNVPPLKIDSKKNVAHEVCRLKKEKNIDAVRFRTSDIRLCFGEPAENQLLAEYIYSIGTKAPVCSRLARQLELYEETDIFSNRGWINQVLKEIHP